MNSSEIINICTDAISQLRVGEINNRILSIKESEIPEELIPMVQNIRQLIKEYLEGREYILSLAHGHINSKPPLGNKIVSSFKELQSTLKHMVWHVKQAAVGNYNQRIDYLGDFSESFNLLINSLSEKKSIENELLKSEQRLKKAEHVARSGNWELDMTVTSFNISAGAAEIFGLEANRAGLNEIMEIALPEYRDLLVSKVKNLIAGIDSYDIEYEIKNAKSGEVLFIHSVAEYDVKENKVIGVIQDITERKKAEKELHLKDEALNSAINPICIANLSGELLYTNPAFIKTWGYESLFEIRNAGVGNLWQSPVMAVNTIINTLKKGSSSGESIAKRKDGSLFPAIYQYSIIHTAAGKPLGIIEAFIDITEQKSVQKKLENYAKELEISNATKDKLFSIIAHDLKSPFQGLLGLTGILSEDYNLMDEEERKGIIRKLAEISRGSLNLLDNLLEWSRLKIASELFHPEIFNVSKEIKDTLGLLVPIASNKKITIINNIKNGHIVNADKNMCNTVIRNLVSNSIKFTNTGGEIVLSTYDNNDFVLFEVKDNGVGMSANKLPLLFGLEKNISTKGTYEETGTGLGLLLCKEMVEKNGGKIWAESKVGEGSRFFFTLPAGK